MIERTNPDHSGAEATPPRRITPARVAALLLLLALLALAWWFGVNQNIRSAEELVELFREPIDALGPARFVAVGAVATLAMLALVPSPLVLAACGLALGTLGGFIVGMATVAVAVTIERWMGSTLVGAWLKRHLHDRLPEADAHITRYGLPGVIVTRLLGTPTAAIAWASAATSLAWWRVSLGSMIGTMPRGFAYVSLGAAGVSLWPPSGWTWQVWVSFALLGVLGLVTVVLTWRAGRANRAGR